MATKKSKIMVGVGIMVIAAIIGVVYPFTIDLPGEEQEVIPRFAAQWYVGKGSEYSPKLQYLVNTDEMKFTAILEYLGSPDLTNTINPSDIGSDTGPAEEVVEDKETPASASNDVSETAVAATETSSLFFHKPNKWLNKAKDVLSKEELPTTGIEKAKDMFKDLRKQTLDSLPRGKEYIALVDNEKCIGCTQCVYFCNFASIDMISWDLQARTSQFESKKALILDDTCTGCTLCAFACPVEAITMEARV